MQKALPEDLVRDGAPPLRIKLRCERCGKRFSRIFEWASVSPSKADDWDGVLLSDIVTCPECEAVDEYQVSPMSLLRLAAMASVGGHDEESARVLLAASELWDGTRVRRPSQALAHLRALTEAHPNNPEAFRRLGNGCKRWNRIDEALAAWRKACDLDEEEVDSGYCLANYLLGPGERHAEGFYYLRRTVAALPAALRSERVTPQLARAVIELLETVVVRTREPIGLMAAWHSAKRRGDPVVDLSVADLSKLESFQRLADLVCAGFFLELAVTAELPDEEPTRLQHLLSGGAFQDQASSLSNFGSLISASPRRAARATPSVGRNEPCPCDSGRKFKRCCGAKSP